MKEAGWSDCAVVAYPTKRIWPQLVRCRPPFVVLADVAGTDSAAYLGFHEYRLGALVWSKGC